jgi:hypothetical protein
MPLEIEQTQTIDNIEPKTDESQTKSPEPVSVDQREPEPEFNPELEQELQVKLQPILLDTAINALGNTLHKITNIEGMDFSEDEHKALVEAWTPLLPSVSPMTNAVLVTIIILSGKGLLYMSMRKKSKLPESKPLPVESKQIQEAVS